jgi:hypothetical protein
MAKKTTEHVVWSITKETLITDLGNDLDISLDDVIAAKAEFKDEKAVQRLTADYADAMSDILANMDLGDMAHEALKRALESNGLDLESLRAAANKRQSTEEDDAE